MRNPTRIAAAGALACALSTPTTAAQDVFGDELVPLPPRPVEAFAAELDGDGRTDLIVRHADHLSVLRNEGGGLLTSADTDAASDCVGAAVADLNGDGLTDVVASEEDQSSVRVYLANGAGGLGYAGDVWTWDWAWSVALGDLNGDGHADLVTGNESFGTASWVLGNGDGTFQGPAVLDVPVRATHLTMGDLDADGDLDVVAAGYPQRIALLVNQNGGLFVGPTADVVHAPTTVDVGQLDGDADLEIVAGTVLGQHFAVADWDGHAFDVELVPTGAGSPSTTSLGDANGDGLLDVVANVGESFETPRLELYPGTGAGTFGAPTVLNVGAGYPGLAELTDDGELDLFGIASGSLRVLEGLGAGSFAQPTPPERIELAGIRSIGSALGDLDGDGWLDVVTPHYDASISASVVLSNGPASFDAPVSLTAAGQTYWAGLADFDADGALDLATLIEAGGPEMNNVSLRLGDGAGGFAAPTLYGTEQFPNDAVIADFDGNGRADLAVATFGPFPNSSVSIFHTDALGSLGASQDLTVPYVARGIQAGDLTGDFLPDLLVGPGDESLAILQNLGSGVFAPGPVLPAPDDTDTFRLVDVDGDGLQDLLTTATTTSIATSTIRVARGNGAGNFTPAVTLGAIGGITHESLAADFDADGYVDIVASRPALSFYRGGAGPSFDAERVFASGTAPTELAAGDLDHDGLLDLVATQDHNAFTTTVTFHRNQLGAYPGVSTFGTGTPSCAGGQAMATSVAPAVGASDFALTCTNAPPSAFGLVLVGTQSVDPGSDPLALGLLLHVDLLSTWLGTFNTVSDAAGTARVPLPIGNGPGLGGLQLFAQTIWIEPAGHTCSPSPLPLASSRGVAFTIAP